MTEPWHLAYISLNHDMTEAELDALTVFSQSRNRHLKVGGFLLKIGETFFQILEGEREIVQALFSRIAADPKHYAVRVVLDQAVDAPLFVGWGMVRLNAAPRLLRVVWDGEDRRPRSLYEALSETPALASGLIQAGALLHDLMARQGDEVWASPEALTPEVPGVGQVALRVFQGEGGATLP